MRRLLIAFTSFLLIAGPAVAQSTGQTAGQTTTPSQLDGFVPLSQLPPGEEMPAAPLLIGAYAFFLVLMMFYLWTIWKRVGKVEKELADLARRHGGAAR